MHLRPITNYSKDIAASVAEEGSVVGFWDIRVSVESKCEYRLWEQKKRTHGRYEHDRYRYRAMQAGVTMGFPPPWTF